MKTFQLEALYFQIYQKVLRLNDSLGDEAMTRDQLREVCTSIFIASTQRGIYAPVMANGFLDSIALLLSQTQERSIQERIYREVKKILEPATSLKE
ncbi:MAG: hypothetical protein H6627_10840 [Calditrichae bacterium]|nr:hypothetical protein [Calditrichia bacterium]